MVLEAKDDFKSIQNNIERKIEQMNDEEDTRLTELDKKEEFKGILGELKREKD